MARLKVMTLRFEPLTPNNSMKEHPILFTGPMVRAILEGRKTQTRRIVNPQPSYVIESHCRTYQPALVDRHGELYPGPEVFGFYNEEHGWKCPYGKPRDRLWVREPYYQKGHWEPVPGIRTKQGRQKWRFVSQGDVCFDEPKNEPIRLCRHHRDPETIAWHKRLARFMPRTASRITLEIVSVRVERLQDITEADAIAEGIEKSDRGYLDYHWEQKRGASTARGWFSNPVLSYRSLWECINGPESWNANSWVWVVEFKRVESEVEG